MTFRYLLCLSFAIASLTLGIALIVDSWWLEEVKAVAGYALGMLFIYAALALGYLAAQARPFSWFGGRS